MALPSADDRGPGLARRAWRPVALLVAGVIATVLLLLPQPDGEVEPPVIPTTTVTDPDAKALYPVLWTRTDAAGDFELRYVTDLDLDAPIAVFSRAVDSPEEHGTLRARSSAKPHRGTPVRFRAMVRVRNVSGVTRLWLRADRRCDVLGKSQDRMALCQATPFETAVLEYSDSLTGDSQWQPLDVTIDVPPDAEWLVYGVVLEGAGEVAIHDPVLSGSTGSG